MSFIVTTRIFRDVILPAADILILAFLLYRSYQILVQTKAIQLVKGAFLMAFIYVVAFFFRLNTLLWILNLMVPGLVIGVAIIFQPELRKIFTRIGQGEWFRFSHAEESLDLDAVIHAAEILSSKRRGALVVIGRQVGLKNFIDTGTRLDAEISSALVLTIFLHDTMLHDGAVVIEGGRIAAAGCFLPLSEQPDIRRSFGTRHRAALGLTEETDAAVVVVSEETGAMSLAFEGSLMYDLTAKELSRRIKDLFLRASEGEETSEEADFEEE